jgi:hypothetical protein
MHHLMGLVPPDQSALSLGRPLCVRRGSRGLKDRTGPLPHHTRAGRGENTGPRLARLGSGAREALTVCTAPTSDRRGGLVGACPNEQRSLMPPNNCVTPPGGTGSTEGLYKASAENQLGGNYGCLGLRQHGADLGDSVSGWRPLGDGAVSFPIRSLQPSHR